MTRKVFVRAFAAAVGIVALAASVEASIQRTRRVCKVSVGGGWELAAQDGGLGLTQRRAEMWLVSAPTLAQCVDPNGGSWWRERGGKPLEIGMYAATDPDGKDKALHLVKASGEGAHWVIEMVESWQPKKVREGVDDFWVGARGARFKLRVADGHFKGWYVGVDPLPEKHANEPAQDITWRPLKLVKDAEAAAVFKYEETEFRL